MWFCPSSVIDVTWTDVSDGAVGYVGWGSSYEKLGTSYKRIRRLWRVQLVKKVRIYFWIRRFYFWWFGWLPIELKVLLEDSPSGFVMPDMI